MYRAICVACLEPTGWKIERLSAMPRRLHYCRACWREVRERPRTT